MALTFSELQSEVLRRATKNQGGGAFDVPCKTLINTSLLRLAREANWRSLRRKTSFNTNAAYTKGSGAVTLVNGSPNVTVTGATFITDAIEIGRYIKVSGASTYYRIAQITGETTLVLNLNYSGTATTTGTYHIYGQETYNLPAQVGTRFFMWHERYGFPLKMRYTIEQDFYRFNTYVYIENVPQLYHMWGEDMVMSQLKSPSIVSLSSASASDASLSVMVMGMVGGYPDSEVINLNGVTTVNGTKVFQSVERVVKNGSSIGLITVTANSGNTTVAIIPVGNITAGIQYKKVSIWPLPTDQFPMYVHYYKDPYKLINDGDVHELGQEFDEALILLSVAKLKADTNQNETSVFIQYYQDEIKNLRKTNIDKIDWFPKMERPYIDNMALSNGRGFNYLQFPGGMAGPISPI